MSAPLSAPPRTPSATAADALPWDSPGTIEALTRAALRAPSADNRHSFVLRRSSSLLRIDSRQLDTSQWPAHQRWLALVSYGAVIESLRVASAQQGWHAHVRLADPAAWPQVATISWSALHAQPAGLAEDCALAQAIEQRRSNRRLHYRRHPDGTAMHERISAASSRAPHAEMVFLDGTARRDALRAIQLAESQRFSHRNLHAEIYEAIRFDVGWSASCAEGLPPASLEVEPPARPVFQALRHWPRMRIALAFGAGPMLGMRSAGLPARLAPGLAAVVADRNLPEHEAALAAGAALLRGWLQATRDGAAVQVLAGAGALARQEAAPGWVSADSKARLQALNDAVAASLPGERQVHLYLRVGVAAQPGGVTGRPDIKGWLPQAG